MNRLPRLTIRRMMALLIPIAANLAIVRRWAISLDDPDVPQLAAVVALVAAAGLAVATYRGASFLGCVVQLTVSPLAVLPLFWARSEWGSAAPPLFQVVAPGFVLVVVAAALSFVVRHRGPTRRPPRGLVGEVLESIEAGVATLGLLLLPACCCFLPSFRN